MKPSTGFVRKLELLVEPIWVPLKTQHWVPWENPALGSAGDAMNPIWVPPGHASPVISLGSLQNPHRVHCIPRGTQCWVLPWNPMLGFERNPDGFHEELWAPREPSAGFHEEPRSGFHEEPRSGFLEPSTGFLWVPRVGFLVNQH
ncbi:hypothetical protein SLEP1_g17029 [Rubroshorea leprosula]|uniref:Uncharacterized protein n=1 Tax=Rubroshorea leprosula TaxID=152421 RepID=A0AAV5J204_9ROSI|nr:hypothetical protein SLEP1_g17029 [Rubroshorea leprosula]